MNKKYKKRKGSITVIALYIFILILASSTMLLCFSTLQFTISKNQLEKIQSRYAGEDNLNKFIYEEENIENYISNELFNTLRREIKSEGVVYDIVFKNGDNLKETIEKASFRLEDIHGHKEIILSIISKDKNIDSHIFASGRCINEVFELKKPFITEENLTLVEKDIFLDFIDRVESENCEYDCKLDSNSMKINSDEDISLELIKNTSRDNKIFSEKQLTLDGDKKDIKFAYDSVILNLKENKEKTNTLRIGNPNNEGLIKLNGVLYIEGDLVIDQDFELLGLLIINRGSIIVNSGAKAKISGAVYYKGDENIDTGKIDIVYDQNVIYKEASFLPGFVDIKIDTIKKY